MLSNLFSLDKIKKVYFIGIGGIGMSGIARLLNAMKFSVEGSDIKRSHITDMLEKENITVHFGHSPKNIPPLTNLIVISSAIDKKNPELQYAIKKRIPIVKRARILSELCKGKKTIAVAGSHGKTTTTSMISMAMEYAKANSTSIIGGIVKNIDSNLKIGNSEYFVIEADESDGSFLYFSPLIACITNIDNDHLDFYKKFKNLKNTFALFLSKIPFYGKAVICADDINLMEIAEKLHIPYYSYGLSSYADWKAYNIENRNSGVSFDVLYKGKKERRINLKVFGLHNIKNALGAYASVKYLGFEGKKIAEGLENFLGVKRRMEQIGEIAGVKFLDDYGHHPTEIENTLNSIKNFYKNRRIIVVFQPHRYTRTKILYKEFGKCFDKADIVYIMPVYPAGEQKIKGVDSNLIINSLLKNGKKAIPYTSAMEVAKILCKNDILLTIGAGDVWKTGYDIKFKFENLYSI